MDRKKQLYELTSLLQEMERYEIDHVPFPASENTLLCSLSLQVLQVYGISASDILSSLRLLPHRDTLSKNERQALCLNCLRLLQTYGIDLIYIIDCYEAREYVSSLATVPECSVPAKRTEPLKHGVDTH